MITVLQTKIGASAALWRKVFIVMIAILPALSLYHLTETPRLWVDEAKNIELAQSFNTSGKLDMELAPGLFTKVPHLLQSTGYPATVPLAFVFKVFGLGLLQARLYMLGWLIATILMLWIFLRRLFDERAAALAVLLVLTFASLYDSGRSMMGELPGFFFLIAGLYWWLCRDSLPRAGLFLGLAVVSKPSIYLLIIPAVAVVALFRSRRIKNIATLALSMLPAAVVWILLVLPRPFEQLAWRQIIELYANPYNLVPISQNIIRNIVAIPHTPTLIYFGVLFIGCVLARFRIGEPRRALFFDFACVYSMIAFFYYLRSPGWLRYIFAAELLILSLLPHAAETLLARLEHRLVRLKFYRLEGFLVIGIFCLVAVQAFHFVTGAKIYFSDSDIKTAARIEQDFSGKHVAYLGALNVAVWRERTSRYLTLDDSVVPTLSKYNTFKNVDPLSLYPLPQGLVAKPDFSFGPTGLSIVAKSYKIFSTDGGYNIYKKLP